MLQRPRRSVWPGNESVRLRGVVLGPEGLRKGIPKGCLAETTLREKSRMSVQFPRYRHLFGLNFA